MNTILKHRKIISIHLILINEKFLDICSYLNYKFFPGFLDYLFIIFKTNISLASRE